MTSMCRMPMTAAVNAYVTISMQFCNSRGQIRIARLCYLFVLIF
jgi:hypothetical protein